MEPQEPKGKVHVVPLYHLGAPAPLTLDCDHNFWLADVVVGLGVVDLGVVELQEPEGSGPLRTSVLSWCTQASDS